MLRAITDSKRSSSGIIEIQAGKIRFALADRECWTVSLADVVLLGEYTTQDGPFGDDYFLVLVTKNGFQYECPIWAQGTEELRQALGQMMRTSIATGLASDTGFASRILAPASLVGQPLYSFAKSKQSMLQRLSTHGFLGLFGLMERRLSPDAMSVLETSLVD